MISTDTGSGSIRTVDALAGLRRSLEAPAEERVERFRDEVMTPLEPFWKPFANRMGSQTPSEGDPLLATAASFGFYTPTNDIAAGLEALERFERAGSLADCAEALARSLAALDPAGHGFPIGQLQFALVLADPAGFRPGSGDYSGNGALPGLVMVNAWPTPYNLPRLPAASAHECNHQVRFRYEPFDPGQITVGQYLVAEGLAEAFAAELFGEECIGPWATDWDESVLDEVRPRYRRALGVRGFDEVRGYIFGDWAAETFGYTPQGVPDFAGYAVGYRLVRDFLRRSGLSAAEATWLPWNEIVAGSRWLEG